MNAPDRIAVRIAYALLSASALLAQPATRPSTQESASVAPAAGRPLRGVVTDLLVKKQLVLIQHEEIPGFLRPMTRAFNVPEDVFFALKSGARIAATLLDQQRSGWHLVDVRLLVNLGGALAPNLPHRVALAADAKNPGTYTGAFSFAPPTSGNWRANVSAKAAVIELFPQGGAPLASKPSSDANPRGFVKGPLYALIAGRTYEICFTQVSAAELDVLLQPFTN